MPGGAFLVSSGARDTFLSEAELRQRSRSGLISPSDRVFHPQLGRWLYAREVAEIGAELAQAAQLGRRPLPEHLTLVPVNTAAMAGFILGVLGWVPLLGLLPAGLGIWLSARGLSRSQVLYNSGHRLAASGLAVAAVGFLGQLLLALWLSLGRLG